MTNDPNERGSGTGEQEADIMRVKMRFWPEGILILLVTVFTFTLCEILFDDDGGQMALPILFIILALVGSRWAANIKRRNLQSATDSEEAETDLTDVQGDATEE